MTSLRFGARLVLLDVGTELPDRDRRQVGLRVRYRIRSKVIEFWIGVKQIDRAPADSDIIRA